MQVFYAWASASDVGRHVRQSLGQMRVSLGQIRETRGQTRESFTDNYLQYNK